jgi:hypothetical protein
MLGVEYIYFTVLFMSFRMYGTIIHLDILYIIYIMHVYKHQILVVGDVQFIVCQLHFNKAVEKYAQDRHVIAIFI